MCRRRSRRRRCSGTGKIRSALSRIRAPARSIQSPTASANRVRSACLKASTSSRLVSSYRTAARAVSYGGGRRTQAPQSAPSGTACSNGWPQHEQHGVPTPEGDICRHCQPWNTQQSPMTRIASRLPARHSAIHAGYLEHFRSQAGAPSPR